MDQVSWFDATNYCVSLTTQERIAGRIPADWFYRLPTEAEWEYACRAGTATRLSYGDDPGYTELAEYGWYSGNSGKPILLTERLGRSYLVNPQVDVDVEEFRSQWVMVTGQVQQLGRIMLRGGTRLKEVLSEAGGFTADAGEAITISRKTRGSDEYEYEVERIDRALFERGEIDPMLNHGDIVDVPRSHHAYIDGEVRKPSRIPIERGLTLMRAISMVGGLTEWANRKQVRILYPGEDGESRVVTYNLKRIQQGKAPDPELHGGETIIIERRYF